MLRAQTGAARPGRNVSTLIISPARELAMQINTEAKQLTKFSNFRCQVCFRLAFCCAEQLVSKPYCFMRLMGSKAMQTMTHAAHDPVWETS